MSKQILKPADALVLLENIQAQAPEKKQAAINTIVESAIVWTLQAQNRDGMLLQRIVRIEKALKIGAPKGAPAPAPQAAPPVAAPMPTVMQGEEAPAAPSVIPPGVAITGEGGEISGLEGLSEDERKRAIDAVMDASIAAAKEDAAAEAAAFGNG